MNENWTTANIDNGDFVGTRISDSLANSMSFATVLLYERYRSDGSLDLKSPALTRLGGVIRSPARLAANEEAWRRHADLSREV